jgi:DNA-binding transcriptional LysR family regulator
VRQLEATLDIALVDFASGRLLLTRDGEKLAQRARLAAAEIAQARAEVAQSMGRAGGQTVIGAMPLARSAIVPRAVLAFTAQRPHHAVTILDGPYETLLWALRNGQADVLIGALRDPAPTAEVLQEHLFDDPLSIIVRAGHPLTSMRRLRPDSLAPYDWIAPPADSPLRRHFDALSRMLPGYRRSAPIECNSPEVARALLIGSDRIMLLSRQQVHHELKSGELAAFPHPLGAVSRAIGLTLRRNWHPTAEQAGLLQIIRQQARAESGLRGGGTAEGSSLSRS